MSERATGDGEGKLTMEGLDALRERIGIDWSYTRWSTWNEEASRDAIRHFAFGFGDDNPLWWDPEYAQTTRWRGIIAPPTFLDTAGITPKLPPRKKGRKASGAGLPGLSMFWIGDHIRYFTVVHEADRIQVRRFYVDVSEKPSREFGKTARATRRRVYKNQNNELVAIWDAEFAMAEHRESREKPESTEVLARHVYTDEEIEEIDAAYRAETIRGAEARFVEDLQVGQPIEPRVKGPLTLSDMIAFLQGSGRHEMYPYRLCYRNRQRLQPFFYPKNSFGAFEPVMRGHWDDEYARSTGLSGSYDFGSQRIAWMTQAVTDWMGDDAVIVDVHDRLERFTTIGDLTRVTGAISNISDDGSWPLVTCAVECTNQHGIVTARADVTMALPSHTHGSTPPFPEAPSDGGLFPGMPEPEQI